MILQKRRSFQGAKSSKMSKMMKKNKNRPLLELFWLQSTEKKYNSRRLNLTFTCYICFLLSLWKRNWVINYLHCFLFTQRWFFSSTFWFLYTHVRLQLFRKSENKVDAFFEGIIERACKKCIYEFCMVAGK